MRRPANGSASALASTSSIRGPKRSRAGEHLGALVDPRHLESALQELRRDEARSRCDVEHVAAVPRQSGDEEAAPARVLAERERRRPRGRTRGRAVRTAHGRRPSACRLLWRHAACRTSSSGWRARARSVQSRAPRSRGSSQPRPTAATVSTSARSTARTGGGAGSPSREDGRSSKIVRSCARPSRSRRSARSPRTRPGGDLDGAHREPCRAPRARGADGIEDAEEAAAALRAVLGEPPQLATPARLDEIGAATRRLEQELDPGGASPFAAALKAAQGAVSELQREIEAGYLVGLET